jgi:hypothetical protein
MEPAWLSKTLAPMCQTPQCLIPEGHDNTTRTSNLKVMQISDTFNKECEGKTIPDHAVRCRGSYIFYTISSQMAVRLLASHISHPLPPGRFLVLISVTGWVHPMARVRLEWLGQLKNPITSKGIKPVTVWLVAWCCDQLHYCVPPTKNVMKWNIHTALNTLHYLYRHLKYLVQ